MAEGKNSDTAERSINGESGKKIGAGDKQFDVKEARELLKMQRSTSKVNKTKREKLCESAECELKSYSLNEETAIKKKLQASSRSDLQVVTTDGGVKLLLNAGTYELLKRAAEKFYSKEDQVYNNKCIEARDKDGNVTETRYKVAIGKKHCYTFNLYHTTCNCLINGKCTNDFLENHLIRMLEIIESCLSSNDLSLVEVNESVKKWIKEYYELKSTGSSDKNSTTKITIDSDSTEIIATEANRVNHYTENKKDKETVTTDFSQTSSDISTHASEIVDIRASESNAAVGCVVVEQIMSEILASVNDTVDTDSDTGVTVSTNNMGDTSEDEETLKLLKDTMISIKKILTKHIDATAANFERLSDEVQSLKNHNNLVSHTTQTQVDSISDSTYKIKSDVADLGSAVQKRLQSISDTLKSIHTQQRKQQDHIPQQEQQQFCQTKQIQQYQRQPPKQQQDRQQQHHQQQMRHYQQQQQQQQQQQYGQQLQQ